MKLVLLVVAVVIAMIATVQSAPLNNEQYQFLFTRFIQQYNKQYETNDFFSRFNVFKTNLDKIVSHNSQNKSWTMSVNKFADLTPVEFTQLFGFKLAPRNFKADPEGPQCTVQQTSCNTPKVALDEIDWRNFKGDSYVNKVKDQGQCGSCWAFSAIQALESQTKIVTGVLPRLSEQQLVDCQVPGGEGGCDGGLMDLSYNIMAKEGTKICSEQSYPYTGRDDKCKQGCDGVVSVSGCTYTKPGVQGAVAQLQSGPIAVALAASFSMQFYSGGLFTDCSTKELNHGVGLVGYLPKKFDRPAYLIRNSWGSSWGTEQGYIYMDATEGKDCLGMDTTASNQDIMGNSQPIVKK